MDKLEKFSRIFKNTLLERVFEKYSKKCDFGKIIPVVRFWKKFLRPPTCVELHSHKNIVVHFFIPMLLLLLTFSLIYLKLKEIKGPKMDSLFFTSLFTFTRKHSLRSLSVQEVEVVGEGRWLLHSQSEKVLKENTARARLARG